MNSRYSERLGRALGVRYSERALFTQTVQLLKCRIMSTNNNMQIKLYAFSDVLLPGFQFYFTFTFITLL